MMQASASSSKRTVAISTSLVPAPGNPQSLNRYAYVYNNPLRYTDPTGHVAYHERTQADEIALWLNHYGIAINQDWGEIWDYSLNIYGWNEGSWDLSDLEAVQRAVQDLSTKMGGRASFVARVTPVSISRVRGSHTVKINGEERPVRGDALDASWWPVTYIRLFNECFEPGRPAEWTVVHELAHAWDFRWGEMGSEWIKAVALTTRARRPSRYAETNDMEHWAEVVKAWVYPESISTNPRMLHPLYYRYMNIAVGGW